MKEHSENSLNEFREKVKKQNSADYFHKLMVILEKASLLEYEIIVKEFKFIVHDPHFTLNDDVVLNVYYSDEDWLKLETLDWQLQYCRDQSLKAHIENIKQNALSKLTPEERAILGV